MADAITPTDAERAGMWPGSVVERLDWIRGEIDALDTMNQQTEERKEAVSHRADELKEVVATTRREMAARDVGLTNTSTYLDRLSDLVASFRNRIGLGGPDDSDDSHEDPPAVVSDDAETDEGADAAERVDQT